MGESTTIARFDWAMKTMLRDKANFDVLEGFLTALLKRDITILELLESESNSEREFEKFNRVDLLVKDDAGEKIIVEVQNEWESNYLERLLYGTSKVIVENMRIGEDFSEVSKVISISIQYFNLGKGVDYIYYGKTEFRGIHNGEPLVVREKVKVMETEEELKYKFRLKKDIFPEYYLLNIMRFGNEIKEDIDEWIYAFKNSEVKDEFKSKNIDKLKEKLNVLFMDIQTRRRYDRYLIQYAEERDIIETAKAEAEVKGIQKGIEEGFQKGKKETAKKMLEMGLGVDVISGVTGLSVEEIDNLK